MCAFLFLYVAYRIMVGEPNHIIGALLRLAPVFIYVDIIEWMVQLPLTFYLMFECLLLFMVC